MLEKWYSLDECLDKKVVLKALKSFEKSGKIEYEIEKSTDILKIDDLDLEDSDIDYLVELFEENDVYPYLDKEDDEDYYDDYSDEEEEY